MRQEGLENLTFIRHSGSKNRGGGGDNEQSIECLRKQMAEQVP